MMTGMTTASMIAGTPTNLVTTSATVTTAIREDARVKGSLPELALAARPG